MKGWTQVLLLLFSVAITVRAAEYKLDQKDTQRCSGMYSKKSWGGNVEPFILVKFLKAEAKEGADPTVSLLVYEYDDTKFIGKPSDVPVNNRQLICNEETIQGKLCNETHKGEWIVADNADEASKNPIMTKAIHLTAPGAVHYPVSRTGYYCVYTYSYEQGQEYTAVVEFRNAYGELPAAQIAKLPFYGSLAIVYAVVGVFWGFLYYQNRQDILPVQNYITAIIVFLVVEMLMTWGFYDYQNRHGNNIGSKALMIVVSILNAGRNSFSFFLLLIVCMGYGVVKHTLGKTMVVVRWLAAAHFVFGVIYAIASLTVHPDDAGPLVLLVILPLSGTLTAFYIWTLNSLNLTIKDLIDRKQTVKGLMYRRLWWCILTSIIVIFGFFFFNSFTFAGVGDADFAPTHWQFRWFVLDGWLNLVYLTDVCFIAYLWRPTANNRRFAMSDEINQDDEGFEIASIRDSLDEEEGRGPSSINPPAYDPAPRIDRDRSPLPAPKPQKPVHPPRESLDGDTIFAVGDEDKWSDDMDSPRGSEGNERKGLTGGST
ncbi:hypothetical protein W97_09324 [Coniosporium apollinis CBS 100218]|uniref:Intimal thickness related receptor IRP domain-containing protein n=1 Tax=Coniosporium apollinis (strain CBS 100218) TaxID=1168221 RepID=R7Z7Z3_CONA1|nr:uncharacterized protein W97_09324 [Coniosporium apollinis CBS 100218]EON70056.1 hypothetical protein W97_09324 [Coniosporium apollinis CBS 100218]